MVLNNLNVLKILSLKDASISPLDRAAQLEENELKNFGISVE
jgi:hypothetical protein